MCIYIYIYVRVREKEREFVCVRACVSECERMLAHVKQAEIEKQRNRERETTKEKEIPLDCV